MREIEKVESIAQRPSYTVELIVLFMMILSVLFVVFNSLYTVTHELKLNFESAIIVSDNVKPTGKSFGVINDSDPSRFTCTLVDSEYRTPFCAYQIFLTDDFREGLDFSNYDSIMLDINYKGPGSKLRIQLLNYNPAYSTPDSTSSSKYNLIELEQEFFDTPQAIDLIEFKVADWWPARNKVPFSLAKRELTNISIIQVQTGSDYELGEHHFKVNNAYLNKKIVSNELLYLTLMFFWLAVIFAFLVFRIYTQRAVISQATKQNDKLERENAYLDLVTEQLSAKATTDSLTKILNREGIETKVEQAWNNYLKSSRNLSIILFDVDNFKDFNDTLGHDEGDRVLVALSKKITENIREIDAFGRWGGEEFLVVCSDTNLSQAMVLAEKLREMIENSNFSVERTVTASFGVATVSPEIEDSKKLFKHADNALYHAKNSGRNQVRYFDIEKNKPS